MSERNSMSIEAIQYMGECIDSGAFTASGPNVILAFAQALGATENIAKTQTADTGKYTYRYADLGDVLDEVKRVAQMFGLSIFQVPGHEGDKLTIVNGLIHESGEWLVFPPMGLRLPNDAQAVGSALTYIRRYSLLTLFGIAPEDDDGRAATQAVRAPEQNQGYRSPAEQMIHAEMAMLDPVVAKRLREQFRQHFNMGLSDLPTGRHGEALTWVRATLDDWHEQEQERIAEEVAEKGAAPAGPEADTKPDGTTHEEPY
jgi:ERF superfamily